MDEFEKKAEFEAEQDFSEDISIEELLAAEYPEEVHKQEPSEKEDSKANAPKIKKHVKEKRKVRKSAMVLLLILVLFALVFLYKAVGCKKATVEDMYNFESDSTCRISEFNGKSLALSYDGVKIIKLDGTQSKNIEYHMANPHMDVSGNMILLYDKDNRKLAVFNDGEKEYYYDSENNIKNAKVNKNGEVVVVSDERGYNYKVTVLNSKGEEEYLWKIGNEYLLDVDISPDGKKLAAVTITTATGHIVQNVIIIDVEKAVELGRTTIADVMPYCVKFAENGMAIVVSDDRISGYNTKAEQKWEASFENRLLEHFQIDEEGNTVVVLHGIKNNSVVRAYTKNGKSSGEYTTDTKASHVDLNSKYIAVCEENKISLVNYSGKAVSEIEIKKAVKDIAVISNDKVIVLCEDCIQLLKL